MGAMTLLVLYVVVALAVSFACSIMEAVLLSVTPAYVAAAKGEAGVRLRRLKLNVERPLSAILSLNTVAHTVGAAGAGAQAADVWGDTYVGVFSGVLTLLILVLTEILPKTLGTLYWRTLAPGVAAVLVPLIYVLWPLVAMSELITKRLSSGKVDKQFRKEELTALADIGRQEGALQEGEIRILKNLLRFRTLRATDIMTPRTVVMTLTETQTVAEALANGALPFSRVPVHDGNVDKITGYVLEDDVLQHSSEDHPTVLLRDLKRPIQVVPSSLSLPLLFETLLAKREHIAVVVDEYGGTAGVVTMEDVIETLLGLEIVDEGDVARDMQELAREQWRKRARAWGITPTPEDDTGERTGEPGMRNRE
jgi:CBS domain containing-hemolysin-like protein